MTKGPGPSPGPYIIDHRYAPPERWTFICRPGDRHKTLVNEHGALLYDYEPLVRRRPEGPPVDRFARIIRFGLASGEPPVQIDQFTYDPGVPIVSTNLRYSRCALDLQACGHLDPDGRRLDVVRWRLSGGRDVSGPLAAVRIEILGEGGPFGPPMFEPSWTVIALDRVGRPTGDMPLLLSDTLLQPAPTADLSTGSAVRTPLHELAADAPIVGAVVIALDGPPIPSDRLPPTFADAAFASERRHWAGVALRTIELRVPDRGIMDLLTAASRSIAQGREARDGLTHFGVGGAIYRGSWMLDGAFLMEAARYLGLADQAQEALDGVLRSAKPDGTVAIIPGHLKETAVAIAAIVRQRELNGSSELTVHEALIVARALDRIDELRVQGGEHGMPPAFADGGLDGERRELTTLLWTLAALSMIRRSGVVTDAVRGRAAAMEEPLRAVLADRVARDRQATDDGSAYLPMYDPEGVLHHRQPHFEGEPEPWESVNPGTATYALAHAIYPGEVFTPDDPIVADFCRLMDAIDDEQGIPAGTGWLPHRAVWTYAASFYAHVWLYAGRPDKAIDYLYAFADHAAPTGVWREEQSLESSAERLRYGDMPHCWAAAEFIRLVRALLVFERGEELELLAGVPAAWLEKEAQIEVERTPTRFGHVSLRVRVDDANTARIEFEADWHRPPRRVVLRAPIGAAAASVDGHPVEDRRGGHTRPAAARGSVSLAVGTGQPTVTGHAAVKAALRDTEALSSSTPFKPDIRTYRQLPIEADPPAHSEYRAILTPFFQRQRTLELEPQIRAIARDLAARLVSARRADAVNDLALPLVVRSLAIALGRPQDADEWLSWGLRNNEPHGRRDSRRTDAYVARVYDEVELRPTQDAFSRIAGATIDGRPLTRLEKLGFGDLILSAGRAAAVNLVCGAIWYLASHPTERARLVAEPTLLATALDEWLRYLSPVPRMPRVTTADAARGPANGRVWLSFLSANHDPGVFDDPERVDLARRPNHHIAFGNGPHTCIGAHLGKLEARVFVEELLRVAPDLRPDGEPRLEWEPIAGSKVPGEFVSLPIAVGP